MMLGFGNSLRSSGGQSPYQSFGAAYARHGDNFRAPRFQYGFKMGLGQTAPPSPAPQQQAAPAPQSQQSLGLGQNFVAAGAYGDPQNGGTQFGAMRVSGGGNGQGQYGNLWQMATRQNGQVSPYQMGVTPTFNQPAYSSVGLNQPNTVNYNEPPTMPQSTGSAAGQFGAGGDMNSFGGNGTAPTNPYGPLYNSNQGLGGQPQQLGFDPAQSPQAQGARRWQDIVSMYGNDPAALAGFDKESILRGGI